MLRLETIEDFEKVDKALSDPNSKLSEYAVIDCGHCDCCRSVTEYNAVLSPFHIHCCGCGNDFYPDQIGSAFLCYFDNGKSVYKFRLQLDDISVSEDAKKPKFLSRRNQRKLFGQVLEYHIRTLKKEQRILSRNIRRLAKLRS